MCHARERSDRAGGWCGRGIPPPTVGTFSKIRVSKSYFRAFKNDFLGNQTYGEELTIIKSYSLNID